MDKLIEIELILLISARILDIFPYSLQISKPSRLCRNLLWIWTLSDILL